MKVPQAKSNRRIAGAIFAAILAGGPATFDRPCLGQEPVAQPAAKPRPLPAAPAPPAPPQNDRAVVRVYQDGQYPSSQQSPAPQVQYQQPYTNPTPTPNVQPLLSQSTMVPMTMQPMVAQPAAMSATPMLVYMTQSPAAAPAVASSFFLPQTMSAPAQPMGAYAMPMTGQPMVAAPMMSQPMVAAPMVASPMMSQPMVASPMMSQPMVASAQPFASGGTMTALTNQSVSMPTSRSATKVRVRGPGPLGTGIARLGERMTQFGKTRIETIQETEMQANFTQPSGGVASFQTSSSTPMLAPQTTNYVPQAQPQPQSAPMPAPQATMASPQSAQTKHGHFWNR